MMNCGKPVGAVKEVIADEMDRFRAFLGRKIEKCSKQVETLPEGNSPALIKIRIHPNHNQRVPTGTLVLL